MDWRTYFEVSLSLWAGYYLWKNLTDPINKLKRCPRCNGCETCCKNGYGCLEGFDMLAMKNKAIEDRLLDYLVEQGAMPAEASLIFDRIIKTIETTETDALEGNLEKIFLAQGCDEEEAKKRAFNIHGALSWNFHMSL